MATTDTITNTLSQGSLISILAGDLLLPQAPADEQGYSDSANLPLDISWVKQSFLVTTDKNGQVMLANGQGTNADGTATRNQIYNRDYTSAILKYTDSSLGGNFCVNPPPQFTRYADIRVPGIHTVALYGVSLKDAINAKVYAEIPMSQGDSLGQGRYYSEAIDDNSQLIHLRFGVPEYNSLTQFFTGFYDSGMASVARTGRISGGFATRFLGLTGELIGLAIAPLFIIPMAIMMLSSATKFFLNTPPTKFYYLRPSMPAYWTAVTNMVNQIATNMGLISYIDTRQSDAISNGAIGRVNSASATGAQNTGVLAHYLPQGIRTDGLLDVKKMACRAKVLQEKYHLIINQVMEEAAENPTNTAFSDIMLSSLGRASTQVYADATEGWSLEKYLSAHFQQTQIGKSDDAPTSQGAVTDPNAPGSTTDAPVSSPGGTEFELRSQAQDKAGNKPDAFDPSANQGWAQAVADYFVNNLADGSEWATFRVDYTGSQQESFSSSTADSPLGQKINGMSGQARTLRMDLADGNVIPGLGTLLGSVKDVIGGVADVLHIDGIAALAGSAFVDIPKHWDGSTASLTHANYTISLRSPYGNPVSQLMNLYVPLSMLLCGALPLSTGAQSHTSPFLCELHDKGRMMTRLGIIDSISVTRGAGNLGFNNQGQALGIDVSFSILDLSSIMAVPIMPGFDIFHPLRGLFDSDNAFSDYLMTLASMPLPDVVYRFPILKYQIGRRIADFHSMTSPAAVGSYLATLPGVNVLGAFMKGVSMP